MNRLFSLLLLAAAALALGGCAPKTKWLTGQWVFDADYTQQKIAATEKPAEKETGIVGGLNKILKGIVAPQVGTGLEGSRMIVTQKELVLTSKEGTGKAKPFEVLDSPDAETITLKFSDGEVASFHREGDRFWTEGWLKTRAYFTRVK